MIDPLRSPSEEQWIATRRYLRRSRLEMARKAADLYPDCLRVGSTVLLTRPEWMPEHPVSLDDISLTWTAEEFDAAELAKTARVTLPSNTAGTQGESYAKTMLGLDRPRLLENRPSYRLVSGVVASGRGALEFGPAQYFDVLDVGEAAAHEFAMCHMAGTSLELTRLPLRAAVGDPTDSACRPMLTAITTLTIRYDKHTGEARYLVHWRDPAKVATNGDFYQVTPVGVFQPAGTAPDSLVDFDLWRCMAREYSEELLGAAEHHGVDYERWPFFQALQQARNAGACRPYLLGIGVDPLTFATDLLTVTVFDAATFDELFADLVPENAEGYTDPKGHAFNPEAVGRSAEIKRMQPAGAAVLELALRHRARVLLP